MIAKSSSAVAYTVWLQKIVDTHVRKTWDQEPSAAEEERCNDLWNELDEQQQERLWGLSSDLNTLRDKETWIDSDWEPTTPEALARQREEALCDKDWDALLTSLRRPPRFLPRPQVDSLRGRAWMEMEHPEVALLFFDNAARLDPANESYRIASMECLEAMSAWEGLVQQVRQTREAVK